MRHCHDAIFRLALAPSRVLRNTRKERGFLSLNMWKKFKEILHCGLRMLVSAGKVILRVCHTVAQTVLAVGVAGWMGFGPGSLVTLAQQATAATVTQSQLATIGTAVAGAVHTTVCGPAAVALGITLVSVGYAVLIVLAFWLLMKLLKSLLQGLLEALDDLRVVMDLAEQF